MPATTVAAPRSAQPASAKAVSLVPFTRAAREHTETFMDVSQPFASTSVVLPQTDVSAYGFLRHIVLYVTATGGAGTATVATTEDAPFNALAEVVLKDVNGAPIVGPLNGYDLYLLNKWGGYDSHTPDPKLRPSYSAPVVGANGSGNFSFALRIPVEINDRDALGSLPNQNAASTYKLAVTLAPASVVYSTAPNTTLPTVRVRAALQAWTQPTQADLRGNAQATTPPAQGTTSYWSKTTINLAQGSQTVRLPRVGNYLRDLIFIYRDVNGLRANGEANLPDPLSIMWETRLLHQYIVANLRDQMAKRSSLLNGMETAGGMDRGVLVQDFCHEFDGQIGRELRDGWLPTTQATRLEISGVFGVAGTLTVLTNDVAPVGEIFI